MPAQTLIEQAEVRWKTIGRARPEMEPAVALQRVLVSRLAAALDLLAVRGLPALPVTNARAASKLAQGVPAFRGESVLPPVDALGPLLRDVCEVLARGGAGPPADHILQTIEEDRLDVATLLNASLGRDQGSVRTGANHLGLDPDLLWLVGELAAGPFAHLLQLSLVDSAEHHGDLGALARALHVWSRGYCWACGSWPALAEVSGTARRLRCSFCGAAWRAEQGCPHCGAASGALDHIAPDRDRPDHRIELCTACSSYLKTIPAEHPTPYVLLPVEDLATADLDIVASDRGYRRPPLPEIGLAIC